MIFDSKAVVTGGSSGLGYSIAKQLIESNIFVYCLSRTCPDYCIDSPSKAQWIDIDFSCIESLRSNSISINSSLKYIFHCAGVYPGTLLFEDHSIDDIQRTLLVNLVAPVLITHQLLNLMIEDSHLCFINSVAGNHFIDRESIYSSSKHSLKIFADHIRRELQSRRIRVTSFFPGGINTPMQSSNSEKDNFMNPDEYAHDVISAIHNRYYVSEVTQFSDANVF